jgi:hypothetical protein
MRSFSSRRVTPGLALGLFTAALAASCGSSEGKKKVEDQSGGDSSGGESATPTSGSSGASSHAGSGGTTGRAGSGGSLSQGGASLGNAGDNSGLGGDVNATGGDRGTAGDNSAAGDSSAGAAGAPTVPDVCGDTMVGTNEDCDGQNLDGASCKTLHGDDATGTLSCNSCSFNDSGCSYCGDHFKNNTEECDGTDLAFAACYSKVTGGSGTLACKNDCTFDYAGCTCSGGYALCMSPTPACKDIMLDEANCGGCGQVCTGSDQCSRGRCVSILGHNVTSPVGVTVDANNVYYLNGGDELVYSVPKAGGTAPVAISSVKLGNGVPDLILQVGSTLYWTTGAGFKVQQVPITGGTGTTFAGPETGAPTGIASDGTTLWWTLDGAAGEVRNAALPAGVAATKVSGAAIINPKRIALTSQYLVIANAGTNFNGSVYRTDLNGANQTPLTTATFGPLWGLCADETHAYFSDTLNNKIYSVPLDASAAPTPLASAESYPWDIKCDGADLYWVNSTGGTVRKMKKTGGTVTTLAQGLDLTGTGWYLGSSKYLAVDGSFVYWTDLGTQYGGGGVFRVSKN